MTGWNLDRRCVYAWIVSDAWLFGTEKDYAVN